MKKFLYVMVGLVSVCCVFAVVVFFMVLSVCNDVVRGHRTRRW